MGKKNNSESLVRKPSRLRSRGESVRQLATHQEEMVEEEAEVKRESRRELMRRDMDDEMEEEVQLDVIKHDNQDLDRVCEAVQTLLSKNVDKVSAKNAFQVPLIDLESLPDFRQEGSNEYAWKRLSSTLENDSKIYGLRVDAIHSITYSMLNTMARRQTDILQEQPLQKQQEEVVQGREVLMAGGIQKAEGAEGQNLENSAENLNLQSLEMAARVDPVLEKNKRRFDQLGSTTLLMDTLGIDQHLTLQLSHQPNKERDFVEWGYLQEEEWCVDEPLMCFIELGHFRDKLEESQGIMRNDEDIQKLFEEERVSYDEQNKRFLQEQHRKWKPIKEEVHFRSTGMEDAIDNANSWIQSILQRKNTKKPMGIGRQEGMGRVEPRVDPEDIIDFDITVEENRASVFNKQTDKVDVNQEVEDRYLTAPRTIGNFQLSLCELGLKPDPALPQMQPQQIEHQVDVRRQMVSILDAKRHMKSLIHQRATFRSVYNSFNSNSANGEISPALCFLTLLHLTNQNSLKLRQIDEGDFYIG